MIDEIFELILKEARSRKGTDLVSKIYAVHMEIAEKVNETMFNIRKEQREAKKHESKTRDPRGGPGQ